MVHECDTATLYMVRQAGLLGPHYTQRKTLGRSRRWKEWEAAGCSFRAGFFSLNVALDKKGSYVQPFLKRYFQLGLWATAGKCKWMPHLVGDVAVGAQPCCQAPPFLWSTATPPPLFYRVVTGGGGKILPGTFLSWLFIIHPTDF